MAYAVAVEEAIRIDRSALMHFDAKCAFRPDNDPSIAAILFGSGRHRQSLACWRARECGLADAASRVNYVLMSAISGADSLVCVIPMHIDDTSG